MLSVFPALGLSSPAALAAAAGSLIAPIFMVEPVMGAIVVIKGFTIVILGGIGRVKGAIVAGLLLGFIDSFGALYFSAMLQTSLASVWS